MKPLRDYAITFCYSALFLLLYVKRKNVLQNRFVSCTLKGNFVSVCPLSSSKLKNINEQDFLDIQLYCIHILFYFIPDWEKNLHKCVMPMVYAFTEQP